jgi:DNA-binding NtrC family response regulator
MIAAEKHEEFHMAAKKPAPLRVLIVDDDPLIRWSLSEALKDRGQLVTEAANAAAARAAIRQAQMRFDVAVVDYLLADSDDLSLLGFLRQASPLTLIILITAFATPELAIKAVDLGAFRVVAKPFDMYGLADVVGDSVLGDG